MMIQVDHQTLSKWNRIKRRSVLVAIVCSGVSCAAISGVSTTTAADSYGQIAGNPYVLQPGHQPAQQSSQQFAQQFAQPPVQRTPASRPTRLPSVASQSANSVAKKSAPSRIAARPVSSRLDSSPASVHTELNASDYELSDSLHSAAPVANYVGENARDAVADLPRSNTFDRTQQESMQRERMPFTPSAFGANDSFGANQPREFQPGTYQPGTHDARLPASGFPASDEPVAGIQELGTALNVIANGRIPRNSRGYSDADDRGANWGQTQLSADTRKNWLSSTTSTSSQQDAQRLLDQAMAEYKRKAWASAEASAWESLRMTAAGIDIAARDASLGTNRAASSALNDLQLARTAIREARDFAGKYGTLDSAAVERIVISHTTSVLKNQSLRNVPPIDASDRYLNEARVRLAELAKYRVEAAQAMDLLAAIHLGRDDKSRLPSQTALCFRRAAIQGQPGNGSLAGRLGMHLAAVGLDQEAKWALEHAITLEPDAQIAQTLDVVSNRNGDRSEAVRMVAQMQSRLPAGYEQNRGPVPNVVQLTPRQFASTALPEFSSQSPSQNSFDTRQSGIQQASQGYGTQPATSPSIRQTTALQQQPASGSPAVANQVVASEYASTQQPAPVQPLPNDASYQPSKEPAKKSTMRKVIDRVGKFW